MAAMRQRLLLVAGWLAAAIGSVLVASGAVAIAGGQVLDRPLRPLTAAEVAALPVVTVGLADATEPQASGGDVLTTGESTVGSDETVVGQPDSDGDRGSAALAETPVSDSVSTDTTGRWDRFTNPTTAQSRVATLEAGKASFAATDGQLHLLWVTPGAGYVAHTVYRDADSITISFSSSREVWLVTASIVDDELQVESGPAPIA